VRQKDLWQTLASGSVEELSSALTLVLLPRGPAVRWDVKTFIGSKNRVNGKVLYWRQKGENMMNKVAVVFIGLIIVFSSGPLAFALSPFEDLKGPVLQVEKWSYDVEEKFGRTVLIWDGHELHKYDSYLNPIVTTHYLESGGIKERYVREVDDSGKITKIKHFGQNGCVDEAILVKYQEGVQVSRGYDVHGDLVSATDMEFNKNGHPICKTEYDVYTGEISTVSRYTYIETGQLRSQRFYDEEGELTLEVNYRYAANGMEAVCRTCEYLSGSEIFSKQGIRKFFELDTHGNWTEERHYKWSERFGEEKWVLFHIHRREITYRDNSQATTNAPPIASMIVTPGLGIAPLTVEFYALGSIDVDGLIVSYSWDFGDGTTGTGVTASHEYVKPGTYTVELTVTDDRQATHSVTEKIRVIANTPPIASMTISETVGIAPLQIEFRAVASSDPDGELISYKWDFGDGTTGTGVTTSHEYVKAGKYTVKLTVTDNGQATHSTTEEIQVIANTSPTASMTVTPRSGTAPLTVEFDASGSCDVDGSIESYKWDFGDGTTGSGVTASHEYMESGTYTVKLTVADNGQATHSTTEEIQVF